jgi:hypothetical protein
VAYDLWTKKTTSANWARGDEPAGTGKKSFVSGFLENRITSLATSRIPWKPIGIIAGVVVGLLFFPGLIRGKKGTGWVW